MNFMKINLNDRQLTHIFGWWFGIALLLPFLPSLLSKISPYLNIEDTWLSSLFYLPFFAFLLMFVIVTIIGLLDFMSETYHKLRLREISLMEALVTIAIMGLILSIFVFKFLP